MYSFVKDIKFCEQLTQSGFDGAIAVTVVNDKLFYDGKIVDGIYKYFRQSVPISGLIEKPTGPNNESIVIDGSYNINWNDINGDSKYFCVSIPKSPSKEILNQINEYKPITYSKEPRIKNTTNNMGIEGIRNYIRSVLEDGKKDKLEI